MFNPMKTTVAAANGGGLPDGVYTAIFECAEYLPAVEADPMTGDAGRKWPKVVFRWKVTDGPHAGAAAIRETPEGTTAKSSFVQVCGMVMGRQLTAGEPIDLLPCVGKRYLLTIGERTDKFGKATGWRHVTNTMLLPNQ